MGKISGSQAVVKCLKEEGIKIIFGYPGGAVIDLFDALMDSDIENVLVRHEQGAVHAADGLARVRAPDCIGPEIVSGRQRFVRRMEIQADSGVGSRRFCWKIIIRRHAQNILGTILQYR